MMSIKIPWQVWACTGVLVIISGACYLSYRKGKDVVKKEWNESIKRGEKVVEGLKQKQEVISAVTHVRFVDKVKVIHEKSEVRIKQIPVFVDKQPDLSGGFRLFYDSAVLNTIPDASGIPNAEPVPAETLAANAEENYRTCHAAIANLVELRQWVLDQREAYLASCKERGVHCSADN